MARPSPRVSQPARETLLLAALAVAGAALVSLVLVGDRVVGTPGWANYTDARWETLLGPRWSLWLALLVGQGALWGILVSLLIRAHAGRFAGARVGDLIATLAPLVVTVAIVDIIRYLEPVRSPLPGHFGKVTVVTWFGILVALVAVAGIARVGRAASTLNAEGDAASALDAYLDLRSSLGQFLLIAGAVIAGAVLAAGALQSALEGYRGQNGRPEAVLAYGLFLSALLAVAYAPAFAAVRTAGERLLDKLEPGQKPGDEDWPLGTPRRNELRAYLDLDIGLVESLRVGIAVLAPLTSGLVSLLLPG